MAFANIPARPFRRMSDRQGLILLRQYEKARKENSDHILFLPDDSNLRVCHLLVVGLGYPYIGGEFILRLLVEKEFPQNPPEARSFTQNGVYSVGTKICLSIGEFHAADRVKGEAGAGAYGWKPVLGIRGFARELVNGIIVPEELNLQKHPDSGKGGIGIEDASPEDRAAMAHASRAYNITHNAALRKQFLELVEANPELKASKAWKRQLAQQRFEDPKAVVTQETFTEAYGAELWEWCETHLTPIVGPIHVTHGVYLRMWDSDAFRKCYLAIKVIVQPGIADAGWVIFLQQFPSVAPARPRLEAWTLQEQGAKTFDFLQRFLVLSMSAKLDERDALIASVG